MEQEMSFESVKRHQKKEWNATVPFSTFEDILNFCHENEFELRDECLNVLESLDEEDIVAQMGCDNCLYVGKVPVLYAVKEYPEKSLEGLVNVIRVDELREDDCVII